MSLKIAKFGSLIKAYLPCDSVEKKAARAAGGCKTRLLQQANQLTFFNASAPLTISSNSFVMPAWRALL